MLFVCFALIGLAHEAVSSGGTSYKGSWQRLSRFVAVSTSGVVTPRFSILSLIRFPARFPPFPCILLNAQIDLYLTYTDSSGTEVDTVVHVPTASVVDEDQSTCGTVLDVQGQPILTQVLHINIDHYPGWNVRFAFTKDRLLNAENQFVLYQVNVTADYPSTKTLFNKPPDSVYHYVQPVDLKNVPAVADTIYAHLNKSLTCIAEQKFIINKDPKQGPLASFKLSYLQVEAFKVSAPQTDTKFDPVELCPRDQHATDMLPVIVGSCLAGLIVITLITYLIYRCQLSDEVLQLTNSSHSSSTTHTGSKEDIIADSTEAQNMESHDLKF